MKKIILIVVCSLFVVGVVGTLVLTFFLGGIVKTAVNSFGPKLTQTNVVLEGASLSPISGTGTLTGLKVSNPPGWKNDQAFSLGTIRMSVAPFSIFGDHIIINELTIDEPVFDYETKFTDNNVSQLLGNVQKYAGSGSATPATSGGKPVKFEQEEFRVRFIGLPSAAPDLVTTLAVECDGEPTQDMNNIRINRKREQV